MSAHLKTILTNSFTLLLRPTYLLHNYSMDRLRADLMAGLTVTVILLPQAIAFALIAELPPEMGLYTAIVGAVVAALWGSSNYNHTGPTSALSLLVLATIAPQVAPGTSHFLMAVALVSVMVGVLQLVMGLARLGILVNFVSDAVIVGFSAGAGIQIAISELRHLLGIPVASASLFATIRHILAYLPQAHPPTLLLGFGVIGLMLLVRRLHRGSPDSLISLGTAALVLYFLRLDLWGVRVMGELPSSLPPLVPLAFDDIELVARLSTGALAITAIGLIQTMAVARTLAAQRGERLDNNQEFVGQGLANIACGFLSGYPSSGSFSRSAVNQAAGARTPMAALFSGLFVLVAMFTLAPLTAYLPRSALAGVLILVAYGMIDRARIRRILRGARGEAVIMLVTFLGMILLSIEFAVLAGILLSLGYYILKTSAPHVHAVVPDEQFRHLVHQPDKPHCPQLGILDIHGDLYFGAVSHVESAIQAHMATYKTQRFLLLRMHGVNLCDFSGILMLENLVRTYRRERGGDVYMTRVRLPVLGLMKATGFYSMLGADHFLPPDKALEHLFYTVLDPAVCIYESDVRVFAECQNLPRPDYPVEIPLYPDSAMNGVPAIAPRDLWRQLHSENPPRVVDVREPREFKQGHIPEAQLMPLPNLVTGLPTVADQQFTVFVCRSGRRSARAVQLMHQKGHNQVAVLEGGMLAWEAAHLLEAVE